MRRTFLLLAVVVLGAFTSLVSAFHYMPPLRAVDVVTLFFSAFASGASLVSAVHEIRRPKSR